MTGLEQCLVLENDAKMLNDELLTCMGGWEQDRKELNKVKTRKEEVERRAVTLTEELKKLRDVMDGRSHTLTGMFTNITLILMQLARYGVYASEIRNVATWCRG